MSFGETPIMCADAASRAHTRELFRRVGDAWSLVVVSELTGGSMRFTELLRAIDGISHRMLTQTLRGLERDGLVSRASFPEIPPRVEYTLTDLGRTLLDPLAALTFWAEDHRDQVEENRRRYDGRPTRRR
jgi:DNA-binding HxlR family transcriptional regulator